jgi:hypothetical protein
MFSFKKEKIPGLNGWTTKFYSDVLLQKRKKSQGSMDGQLNFIVVFMNS